jgi:hypothetical protein
MKLFQKIKLLFANYYLLITIFLVGGFLRFYNLNWDQGYSFHPDERNIANAVSQIHFFNQLNPKFFAYGSLPIYLYRLTGDFLTIITHNQAWTNDWGFINLIGRFFSALFSTLTLILVFLLAKKGGLNQWISLVAAFFTAFSPSLIQTAHFGVTESMLVFWLILISIISLNLIENPNLKNYFMIGIILGLAIATKISALSFTIVPLAIQFLYHFKFLKNYLLLFFSFLIAFITFTFFSPYVFLDQQKFLESMNYETGVALGRLKVVYILQFEKTLPWIFQIKNFFWQMGPVALMGIIGIIGLLIITFKSKNRKILILLSFPLAYFLYVGSWYTKFIRYMVPILPFLAIFASWILYWLLGKTKILGRALAIIFLITSFAWSLAFFSIYTRESTRITASRWVYQNIPTGAKILTEHWDDSLPISFNNHDSSEYQTEQLTIYEPDNERKVNYYAEKLSKANYLIINSRRLYGTLMYLPEKYPITSRYYRLLFTESLGFKKVAEFTSYPSLLGFEINDDKSEETFQVYDHPKVLIFQNTSQFDKKYLSEILENDR